MSRAVFAMVAMAAVALVACTPMGIVKQRDQVAAASPDPLMKPEPPRESDPPKQRGATAEPQRASFALAVNVREITGRRISGAVVELPGTDIDVLTDAQGRTRPVGIALPSHERFPYDVHVSKAGFQTCVIKFRGMVFPRPRNWSAHDATNPYQLFVYMPTGDGIATGDACYGGRTQPQTPGPVK